MMDVEYVRLPDRWANPAVLEWARLQIGLDPKHVESLANIPAEHVVAWEKAKETPNLADLEVLAEVYACPVGYFFLDSPPDVKPPLNFRGLALGKVDTLSYETHLHLQEFVHLTEYAGYLVETLGLPWEAHVGSVNLREPVERIAQRERERLGFTSEMRQQWSSPEEAFGFWRMAIENQGVLVVALKLNPQEVRGASQWSPPHPPTILVNRADREAATGRIFTLLHEWAHLLVNRPGLVCDLRGQENVAELERFANMFAAEMLVPRGEFGDFLKAEGLLEARPRWGDPVLDRIRTPFKVSRDVVAIRLEEMSLAPSGFYHSKLAIWEQRTPFFALKGLKNTKGGLTKARRRLMEVGLPLAKLVATGYEHGVLSKLDLAELLNMKVEQAERFVKWVQEEAGHFNPK